MPVESAAHQKPDEGRPGRASREAAGPPGRGEAPPVRQRDGNSGSPLLEQALTRENMERAWKRVSANKGSAGVDGRSVSETGVYLRAHWPRLKAQVLEGTYRPSPIRRVEIAKPEGGVRELGIPTVTDRLIQQALLQVLQPLIDPGFSEHSYGFRPGRRAHDALLGAQAYVQAGYRVVVDIDLERFFDRVNHDVLLERLSRRIGDRAVLRHLHVSSDDRYPHPQ